MTGALVWLEAARLLRSPWSIAMLLLFALGCAYALASGHAAHRTAGTDHAAFLAKAREDMGEYRATLVRAQSGVKVEDYEARPMAITKPAVLPDHPLADFAIGARDLFPTTVTVRLFENSATLFRNYQFENPDLLRFGRLDLVAIVVVVLPLLMIAISFDVIATDRGRGTLRLLLAQGVSLRRVIWTRLLLRNGLLWATLLLTGTAGWTLVPASSAGQPIALMIGMWMLVALLYAFFWLAVIGAVVSLVVRSDRAAAALLGTWTLIVLVIPAACSAIAEQAHPSPSRLAYHSAERAAAAEGARDGKAWLARRLRANPQLETPPGVEPPYRDAYVTTMVVEDRARTLGQQFVTARAARERLLAKLQFVSPALVAERALFGQVGADAARYQRFQDDAVRFFRVLGEKLGPATIAGERLTLAEYDALPTFDDVAARDLSPRLPILTFVYLFAAACIGIVAGRKINPGSDL